VIDNAEQVIEDEGDGKPAEFLWVLRSGPYAEDRTAMKGIR
jgi:hypothetical protein